jgi:hypothetical protein
MRMSNMALIYLVCINDLSLLFSDFSLNTWLANNDLVNVSELMTTDYKVSQLMDELAISQYLQAQSCSLSSLAVNGWTSCKILDNQNSACLSTHE